jgi:hypothetical protein
MKRISFLLMAVMLTSFAFGQKKEKLKGSRNVTIEQKEISAFENLEVEDNLDVFLAKGDKCGLEIEADDNIHDAIMISENGGTLRLSVANDVYGYKKLSVKITYTDDFKMLLAKDDANVTALTDMKLDNFTFKTFGGSKIFATVTAKVFMLISNDKSKSELNLTAENTTIEMNKTSQLKALVSSPKMKFDMYQKALAAVEGDVIDLKLRVDNSANFTGKNLAAKNAEIISEGNANTSINVTTYVTMELSGKSEVELYGDQKIQILKFTDSASLRKRPLK